MLNTLESCGFIDPDCLHSVGVTGNIFTEVGNCPAEQDGERRNKDIENTENYSLFVTTGEVASRAPHVPPFYVCYQFYTLK